MIVCDILFKWWKSFWKLIVSIYLTLWLGHFPVMNFYNYLHRTITIHSPVISRFINMSNIYLLQYPSWVKGEGTLRTWNNVSKINPAKFLALVLMVEMTKIKKLLGWVITTIETKIDWQLHWNKTSIQKIFLPPITLKDFFCCNP